MAEQIYYSVFTKQGLALLTEAIQNGTKLGITSMAFGDGGGSLPVPNENFTSMVREVHRTQLNSLAPDPNNANWLRAEAIIASAVGGFNIRELGLYAGDVLVAYSNYPATYKPNPADGTARIMTFRMILQIDNTASFELVIDPDVVLATIQKVENAKQELYENTVTVVETFAELGSLIGWEGRTAYVKEVGNYKYKNNVWIPTATKAEFITDLKGDNQQIVNNKSFDMLRWVTPQMFGAKGDGITDDSDAFAACVLYVTLTAFIPTVGSNRIIGTGIRVPATNKGYRIAQPRRFIPNLGGVRYVGLCFEGDGLARIHFDFNDDDYMCYNNNQFLQVKFRNLDFSCSSDSAKFLYSTGAGGAQDYSFDNCNWNGRWNKLYVLRGENNNSEWSWLKCGITCTIRDVMLDIADSDQFLNYWFYGCKLWLYDGQCVRASAGGHIKFIYCDWSGLQGTREQCTSVNGKYLFELTGNVHARGVCDFRIIGGRFECKINSANNGINARLLYCEWNQGNIELSYDASSTIINEFDSEYSVHIKSGNTAGPILSIHDSYIVGKLKFETNTAAYGNRHLHSIRDTTFGTNTGLSKPSDFIDIIKPSLNVTGAAAIKLSNCRCSSADKIFNVETRTAIPFDVTLGSRNSISAAGTINSAEFKGSANGNNPISNQDCFLQLPPNSTILSIKITCDGLGTTTTASTWVVSDSASGTALLTCAAHKLNERWSEKSEIPFFSATGLLKLVDSAAAGQIQSISGFRALIEYVC